MSKQIVEMDFNLTVARRLRAARQEAQRNNPAITWQSIADCAGIAYSTISQYETGKTLPSLRVLSRLCGLYGVPVDFVITRNMSPLDNVLAKKGV